VSKKQEHRSRTDHESEQEEPLATAPDEGTIAAQEASKRTEELVDDLDAVLDETDRLLQIALGFAADEQVDAAELEKRTADIVAQYQQKGGQ